MSALPSQKYHNSHFHGRSHKSVRFHPWNCDGFCAGCHSILEDEKSAEYREWKIDQIGEEKFEELWRLKNGYMNYGAESKKLLREILQRAVDTGEDAELLEYINANTVENVKPWHKTFE